MSTLWEKFGRQAHVSAALSSSDVERLTQWKERYVVGAHLERFGFSEHEAKRLHFIRWAVKEGLVHE